jgi:CheY-like chemotaxis protein
MPIMDGFTASRKIRKQKKFDAMPILALTANALAEEKEKARQAGMNDYITKPIEPRLFFEKIAQWTNRKKVKTAQIPVHTMLSIPGVDVGKGLSRLNGDQSAYVALLNKFVINHEDDLKQIEVYVREKDWKKAGATLHAMKGVAANLSAVELVQALEKIEASVHDKQIEASKDGISTASSLYEKLKKEMKALNRSLATEKETLQAFDKKDLRGKLEQLLQLVNRNNPEAKAVLREILKTGSLGNMRASLTEVQTALDRYQFKQAGALLRKVLDNLR